MDSSADLPATRALVAERVAMAFAVLTVLQQIAYPLVSGSSQRLVTIGSVITFFVSSTTHALASRGVRAAGALVVIAAGGGFVAEVIGSRTGIPFGNYAYRESLGVRTLGVPVVVALAWAMMAWPTLLAARLVFSTDVRRNIFRVACFGALILASWDLFLDPQMTRDGHWVWLDTPGPWMNGVPMLNSVGWLVVSFVLIGLLHRAVAEPSPSTAAVDGRGAVLRDAVPFLLLGWTWFSEWFGHLVFFGRPMVALVGGVAMTFTLVPVVLAVRRRLLGARVRTLVFDLAAESR